MANTLAYYDTATITAVKSFIVQAPGFKIKIPISFFDVKIFNFVTNNFFLISLKKRMMHFSGAYTINFFTTVINTAI